MKTPTLLLLLLIHFNMAAQEKYYLVSDKSKSEATYEAAVKSKNFISINTDSGKIAGEAYHNSFKGEFEIKRTSSGFVKGFIYRMELGFLQRDFVANKPFNTLTTQLSKGTKFYFYPDILASPRWHFLEISSANVDEVLVFVKAAL